MDSGPILFFLSNSDTGTCSIDDVRLTSGTTEGILEVLYKGDCPAKWVHLCKSFPSSFSDDDDTPTADVVCRMLGFRGTNHQEKFFPSDPSEEDNLIVTCNGFETSLEECETIEASGWLCQNVLGVICDVTRKYSKNIGIK